jgi:hypothetical protein
MAEVQMRKVRSRMRAVAALFGLVCAPPIVLEPTFTG